MHPSKLINVFLLMIIPASSFGQVPDFESNFTDEDSLESEVINNQLFHNYDFIFSYTGGSYWTRKKSNVHIIGLKNDKWFYTNIIKEFNENDNFETDSIPSSTTVKKHKLSKRIVKKLLNEFTQNRLWELGNDSLNIYEKKMPDGTSSAYIVTDGPTYKFELITPSKCRTVFSYHPRYYLEAIPEVYTRQNFINCMDAIRKLIINKYQH